MKSYLFPAFFILLSCSHGPSKKNLEAFEKKITDEKLKDTQELKASKDTRLALKKGQWVKVVTHYLGKNQDKHYLTYKVLNVSGNKITMEIESLNASNLKLNVLQYEIENYPIGKKINSTKEEISKLVEKMKINKMRIRNGDLPAEEISKAYMPMAKGLIKSLFISGYQVGTVKEGPCQSPYLKSAKCYISQFQASVLGREISGTSQAHSEIPILGFIKSVSEESESIVINFGNEGAKSSL
jgi:hypothetical protein